MWFGKFLLTILLFYFENFEKKDIVFDFLNLKSYPKTFWLSKLK